MARLKSNASEVAFQHIKGKIDRFDLVPGDTVSDLAFSQELEMSRTPIREAIQNLEMIGLVQKERTRYTVTPVTQKDVTDIFIARIAIEKAAIECIMNRNGLRPAELEEIRRIHEDIRTCLMKGDFSRGFSEDAHFHRTLVSYSWNTRLIEFMKTLASQGERLRWLSILNAKRPEGTISEHESLIHYIEMKDLDSAIYYIEKHLYGTLNEYRDTLADDYWLEKILQLKNL